MNNITLELAQRMSIMSTEMDIVEMKLSNIKLAVEVASLKLEDNQNERDVLDWLIKNIKDNL